MKKTISKIVIAISLLMSVKANAQFILSDVKFWVGTGTDTSLLVVDFQDGTFDTSYAWGYLHNGSATAEDMLNAIDAADVNLSVAIGGGFLNDISYGSHAGIGGASDFYWGTWSGTNIATLASNTGITETLSNGDWFACSYTDFNPAILPGEPIPAFDPFYFKAQDVTFWVGTGTDTTLLVIDFLDSLGTSSFAWGYLHSGVATAQQMLIDIDAADPNLSVAIGGGFLNDITYNSFSGIGGNPNFWGTWSATNLGNWDMNMGINATLGNGDLFGCSYTDFNPALRPGYPTAASISTLIADNQETNNFSIYPNPSSDFIYLKLNDLEGELTTIKIMDATGKLVYIETTNSSTVQIPIAQFAKGIYNINFTNNNIIANKSFIKQ